MSKRGDTCADLVQLRDAEPLTTLGFMTQTLASRISAGMGFLAVALGAFGAHGLSKTLAEHKTTEIWQTAALYHLVHSVMLVVVCRMGKFEKAAWACFLAGILIFSGSLYFLAALNIRWLGAVTPFGGLALLAGWLLLLKKP